MEAPALPFVKLFGTSAINIPHESFAAQLWMDNSSNEPITPPSKPHLFLAVPSLFIINLPNHVTKNKITELFKTFEVVSVVITKKARRPRSKLGGPAKTSLAHIEFASLAQAEKALVTLHDRPIPNTSPPVLLVLSTSSSWATPSPAASIHPRWVRNLPLQYKDSDSELYDLLRPFGPIASVQANGELDGVVQFWSEQDACDAERNIGVVDGQRVTLQAYNPCNLFCTNLDLGIDTNALHTKFSEFGYVLSARVMFTQNGISRRFGFVLFRTSEEASAAKKAMDSTVVGSSAMIVRFHESKVSPKPTGHPRHVHPEFVNSTPKSDPVISRSNASDNETVHAAADSKVKLKNQCTQNQDFGQRVDSAREEPNSTQEHDVQGCETGIARTEAEGTRWQAEVVRLLAEVEKLRVEAAEQERSVAQNEGEKETLMKQQREQEEALKLLKAEQEAMRAEVKELKRQLAMSESRRKIMELEADRPLWEAAKKQREMKEKEEAAKAEELRKQAELVESQRKMRGLKAEEAARKRALEEARQREAKKRAMEEKVRKEKEEAEKKAREKEERERKERELRRLRQWKSAAEKEQMRCLQRDSTLWGLGPWTKARALERFRLLSDEFDKIKFSEAQPLTFEVVPWPVLDEPFELEVEDLEWSMVERFFASVKNEMGVTNAEYKSLVEKAHRMFHPDKWRSRGLLPTVFDKELRTALETAGNVVAQALTPLWRKSRGYD